MLHEYITEPSSVPCTKQDPSKEDNIFFNFIDEGVKALSQLWEENLKLNS